jgi:hypothetical protein
MLLLMVGSGTRHRHGGVGARPSQTTRPIPEADLGWSTNEDRCAAKNESRKSPGAIPDRGYW